MGNRLSIGNKNLHMVQSSDVKRPKSSLKKDSQVLNCFQITNQTDGRKQSSSSPDNQLPENVQAIFDSETRPESSSAEDNHPSNTDKAIDKSPRTDVTPKDTADEQSHLPNLSFESSLSKACQTDVRSTKETGTQTDDSVTEHLKKKKSNTSESEKYEDQVLKLSSSIPSTINLVNDKNTPNESDRKNSSLLDIPDTEETRAPKSMIEKENSSTEPDTKKTPLISKEKTNEQSRKHPKEPKGSKPNSEKENLLEISRPGISKIEEQKTEKSSQEMETFHGNLEEMDLLRLAVETFSYLAEDKYLSKGNNRSNIDIVRGNHQENSSLKENSDSQVLGEADELEKGLTTKKSENVPVEVDHQNSHLDYIKRTDNHPEKDLFPIIHTSKTTEELKKAPDQSGDNKMAMEEKGNYSPIDEELARDQNIPGDYSRPTIHLTENYQENVGDQIIDHNIPISSIQLEENNPSVGLQGLKYKFGETSTLEGKKWSYREAIPQHRNAIVPPPSGQEDPSNAPLSNDACGELVHVFPIANKKRSAWKRFKRQISKAFHRFKK